MPEVFAWPPVGVIGHEQTITRPGSVSLGLSGTPYFSQSRRTRRQVTAQVSGIGPDLMAAGWLAQLKRMMDGKLPLVRFQPLPVHWLGAIRNLPLIRGTLPLNWASGGDALQWDDDGSAVVWIGDGGVAGTADLSGDWPALDCTGLPPSTLIAAPGERIAVGSSVAHILRPVQSDAAGAARIHLDQALPSGAVLIGEAESVAFRLEEFPRAVQPLEGGFSYSFSMIEVFADEFADGFTEVNPWS